MALQVSILPFAGTDKRALNDLVHDLAFLSKDISVIGEVAVPKEAYSLRRRQYKAETLLPLAYLPGRDRILAVTELDLYAGDLNFVFGIADSGRKAALISLHRLRIGASERVFRERTVKEAVHELGHTLGLSHCHNRGCVMRFSNSLADTDRKGKEFCMACRTQLPPAFQRG